jgi:penicillin-binding protein 1A
LATIDPPALMPLFPFCVTLLARLLIALRERLARWRKPTRREWGWAALGLAAFCMVYLLVLIALTPAISDIRKARLEQPAQLMSGDGKLLAEFKWANRVWVPLDAVAPAVVRALIATEDHRFYEHWGLDWRRTASAAVYTLSGKRQGGSTLTQQLARNLYPEDIGRAPTLNRKLKEAITAFKIEALYTKREILETYLNTVPFLYNAYGIEMAARTYFDKSAGQLSLLESATLVGMLKGNSYYNPVLNPERSVARRNTVLSQMVKREQLAPAQYEALKTQPLRIEFERQTEPAGPAPHLAQHLRQWLINWADKNDYSLYRDGLVVRTTIDSRLQAAANQAVARQGRQLQALADATWRPRAVWGERNELVRALVRETPEYRRSVAGGEAPEAALKKWLQNAEFMRTLREQKTRVQASFMALDPRDGQVRAWVGSRDFVADPFDHVQQARRQPGSTFKPFVYGAAFDQGASPDDTLMDQVVEIPLAGGEIWRPTDGGPPSGRSMSLRDGLAYSKNTITAQLMQTVGPARVAKLARAMGVQQSKLELVPSLALGTSPVTLKEMVSAYGTIANGGAYLAPTMVTRIENRQGEVLAEFAPVAPQQALSQETNYALLDSMRGVVNKGTASAIRSRYGIRADVAGKTGTTQDNADGWFILMHPQLVAGAWVGFNDGRITLRSDYWGQGAHSALPIVGEVTAQALRSRVIDPRVKFEAPAQGFFSGLVDRLRNWLGGWRDWLPDWPRTRSTPAPETNVPPPEPSALPAPELEPLPLPAPVLAPASAPAAPLPAASTPAPTPAIPAASASAQASQPGAN